MKPRHLEVFYAIMVSSSLTEAARRLAVSQPAVSATLRQIEEELGLSLFERLGGRLVPTTEAELLLPEVERIFLRLQTLQQRIKDIRGGASSFLSLAGAATLADSLVPKAVGHMRERRPSIRVRVELSLARQTADKVARREVDLGLIYGVNANAEVGGETVGEAAIVCVMRADHPYAILPAVSRRHLVDQLVFTYAKGTPIRDRIDYSFQEAGLELTAAAEVAYALSACYLALDGGIALVDSLVGATPGFPDLVIRPLDLSLGVPIQLLYLKSRQRSRLCNEMLDELKLAYADAVSLIEDMCAPGPAHSQAP